MTMLSHFNNDFLKQNLGCINPAICICTSKASFQGTKKGTKDFVGCVLRRPLVPSRSSRGFLFGSQLFLCQTPDEYMRTLAKHDEMTEKKRQEQ